MITYIYMTFESKWGTIWVMFDDYEKNFLKKRIFLLG